MYMYPVVSTTATTTTELSSSNNNSNSSMSRNRSLSATAGSPPAALLSRGFASLRRAHRRLSNSSPTSPLTDNTQNSSIATGLGVITNDLDPTIENINTAAQQQQEDANSVRPRIRLVPNVGLSSRSFVFDIIDRELETNIIYRIGRFSDRNALTERLSFKSKVVSRNHAEIWTEQGKVYIRDIGSSSGTFLNRIRLSPPSHVSEPHEVKDGDTIQLGVDYQGGIESIYRAVRIRVEINRQTQNPNSPFARTAFQQLRSHLIGTSPIASSPINDQTADLGLHREPTKVYDNESPPNPTPLADMMSRHNMTDMSKSDIQECCICLYAIAPFQALFIAPCSHIFHFKCLRPIVFQNYPGFSCPLCRNYFDLEASVAIEVDEVLEAINNAKEQKELKEQQQQVKQIDTVPEVNEEEDEEDNQPLSTVAVVATDSSIQPSSSNYSNVSDEEEVVGSDQHIKNRLSTTPPVTSMLTPPVPYITIPNNTENEVSPQPSTTSTQAIDMSHEDQHLAVNRSREALLSSTLVESPNFGDHQQDGDNNVAS